MKEISAAAQHLGVVVIGQAPRPEIISELKPYLSPERRIDLRGALDHLSRAEIDAMMPLDGHDTLFTRLPDNSAAILSKKQVAAGVNNVLKAMSAAGLTAAMICCTGAFPQIDSPIPVLLPSEVIRMMATVALPAGCLALITPLESQFEQAYQKWGRDGIELEVFALVPELEPGPEVTVVAQQLVALKPDLVVLDCMSYREATRQLLRQHLNVPIILAISATARVLEELSL